jgi:hypothetical protein
LAAALITTSFQLGSAFGLAVFSGIATSRTSHLLAARTPPPEAPTAGFQQARGCPQNTELCVINDATGTDAKACRSAGPRAFSPTSLVAQRDAGTGRRTLRAFASSCALTAWAGAADSAAAYPGMAACRGPTRWTPLRAGARLRTGSRSRTPAAPGSSWPRFPPLAHCAMTGDQLRGQDDGPRAACTCGRRCQRHGNPEDPVGGRCAHSPFRTAVHNMQAGRHKLS